MTLENWGRLLDNLLIFSLVVTVSLGIVFNNNIIVTIGLIWLSLYAFESVALKRKVAEQEARIKELEDALEK